MGYTANFRHGDNGAWGTLALDATDDESAIEEVKEFVRQGYRNETTAGVDLQDGRHYQAWNQHGEAKGRRT